MATIHRTDVQALAAKAGVELDNRFDARVWTIRAYAPDGKRFATGSHLVCLAGDGYRSPSVVNWKETLADLEEALAGGLVECPPTCPCREEAEASSL